MAGAAVAAAAGATAGAGTGVGADGAAARVQQHKTVPRWLRVSVRMALLVFAITLLALGVQQLPSLARYKQFGIVFVVVGAFVLPLWEPLLGNIVLMFTLILPIAYAALWAAYGLFVATGGGVGAMMGLCVAVTFAIFFVAELLSLPVALLSVAATIFAVGANSFLATPPMALFMAKLLSGLLPVAAVVAVVVAWLVFPEFCVDEVLRHHHEGLEHLLHLAAYAVGAVPPPLVRRVASSTAAAFGEGAKWRAALAAAADDAPPPEDASALLAAEKSVAGEQRGRSGFAASFVAARLAGKGGGGAGALPPSSAQAAIERSWHRARLAFDAGAKAQVGARAEAVLLAMGHKRIIVPWCPLLPQCCRKRQLDDKGLLALRHVALAAALDVVELHSATQPLDPVTSALLSRLLNSGQYAEMCGAFLAALSELLDAFPADYYPAPRGAAARAHGAARAFGEAVERLQRAVAAGQLDGAGGGGGGDDQDSSSTPAAGTAGTAAAAAAEGQQQQQHGGDAVVVDVPNARQQRRRQRHSAAAVLQAPLVAGDSPGVDVLARINVSLIVRRLQALAQRLEQLAGVAERAGGALVRCRF